jgi:hypothetical protein
MSDKKRQKIQNKEKIYDHKYGLTSQIPWTKKQEYKKILQCLKKT